MKTRTQQGTTDKAPKKKVLQEFPGNMGVRCNEGYDPWIVRLGPAEESDTLMKTRTRRGHDGHDRTKQIL